MKKLYLIFGIVTIVLGLLVALADILVGTIFVAVGILFLWMRKKLVRGEDGKWRFNAPVKKDPPRQTATSSDNKKTLIFNAAGVTYDGRQNIIKKIVDDWKEENPEDLYSGMTNKDIREAYENVAEVDAYGWGDMELIPEPDNEHDPNAVKVVTEYGVVGYVPASDAEEVNKIINGSYKLSWQIVGGKYKYFDEDEDKIMTDTLEYGIKITLTY